MLERSHVPLLPPFASVLDTSTDVCAALFPNTGAASPSCLTNGSAARFTASLVVSNLRSSRLSPCCRRCSRSLLDLSMVSSEMLVTTADFTFSCACLRLGAGAVWHLRSRLNRSRMSFASCDPSMSVLSGPMRQLKGSDALSNWNYEKPSKYKDGCHFRR